MHGIGIAHAVEVEQQPTETASDERTMEVLITDENDQPLAGAEVYVSIWEMPGERDFPSHDYTTDENGIARVAIPQRLQILRLWPSARDHVPEFLNFAEGTHEDGKLIPERYQFKLAKGTRLSGVVVNEEGEPVAGVKVEVNLDIDEPAWTSDPEPMICTRLTDHDFNEGPLFTDGQGRWSVPNAPAPKGEKDYEFRVKLFHEDYVRDSQWGKRFSEYGITTAMLRDGTSRIILPKGIRVTGTVAGEDGQPVTEGIVIVNEDPNFRGTANAIKIDETGHFEMIPLAAGEYLVTVLVPGFAPEQRMVAVNGELEPLAFSLKPGKRLSMKVVDNTGTPIPRATVRIESWRNTKSLFNENYSHLPKSSIPLKADEEGNFIWDWAPADPVSYSIYATSDYTNTTVALTPRDEPHVVALAPRLKFSGSVTDAKTGKPISEFRVVPVTVFRPNFFSTSFQNATMAKEGHYELPIQTYDDNYRYQMRIEAPGYRSAMGKTSYGTTDGAVVQDFQLEPAQGREGIVLDPDGKPVAKASVVVGTPSIVPMMDDGELQHAGDGERIKTNDDGSFELNATWEPMLIRVTHKSGFAEVHREPDEPIGTLQLQPWARLSGRLIQDGEPVANQLILFRVPGQGRLGIPRFQDSFQIRTDPEGRFEFKRMPPMVGSVGAYLGPWQESPLTSSQSVPLDLKPGEHRQIELGGEGIAVTGKVVATGRGDVPLDKNWSLNYLVSRDRKARLPARFPQLSFDPDGRIEPSWVLDPEFQTWLATHENYFVKLSPKGDLRISGVPAGQYDLVLKLYEQPAGCLVQTVGERIVPVEVTEADVAAGGKALGEIEVVCRVGPTAGEDMRAYKFVDAEGREQYINDKAGKYVLMHVWASWCASCLATMPDVAATVENLAEQPIVFVGLNVDADEKPARALVEKNGWRWAQNYLGDDSTMAKQLAISSVPSYYLIGPEGKLMASATEWSEIKAKVEEATSTLEP
jgi:uncharacterized GH25 family protein/thiol-disulfide isomerase/thioredoxin